jgi:hypothetical protein
MTFSTRSLRQTIAAGDSVSYSCSFVCIRGSLSFFLLCGSSSLREKFFPERQDFPVEKPE